MGVERGPKLGGRWLGLGTPANFVKNSKIWLYQPKPRALILRSNRRIEDFIRLVCIRCSFWETIWHTVMYQESALHFRYFLGSADLVAFVSSATTAG
jgi:hypothetical protein